MTGIYPSNMKEPSIDKFSKKTHSHGLALTETFN